MVFFCVRGLNFLQEFDSRSAVSGEGVSAGNNQSLFSLNLTPRVLPPSRPTSRAVPCMIPVKKPFGAGPVSCPFFPPLRMLCTFDGTFAWVFQERAIHRRIVQYGPSFGHLHRYRPRLITREDAFGRSDLLELRVETPVVVFSSPS